MQTGLVILYLSIIRFILLLLLRSLILQSHSTAPRLEATPLDAILAHAFVLHQPVLEYLCLLEPQPDPRAVEDDDKKQPAAEKKAGG